MIIRFHRFTDTHKYEKPNDVRGLKLMSKCAREVTECVVAPGA